MQGENPSQSPLLPHYVETLHAGSGEGGGVETPRKQFSKERPRQSRSPSARDKHPARGVMCSSSNNERNPNALLVVREGSLSRLGRVSCRGSDGGASPHLIGICSLPPEELKTVTNSDTPCLITTENGTVETGVEAAVYKELDVFLRVKLVNDSPAVLSLGMLCETMGVLFFGSQESRHL